MYEKPYLLTGYGLRLPHLPNVHNFQFSGGPAMAGFRRHFCASL
ncbi:hypothetical protein [Bacillus siamensis]|nr:hypothetical protein [Bacillus siamensis]